MLVLAGSINVRHDLGPVAEDDVTRSGGPRLSFPASHVGTLTASFCKEQGATDEPGPCLFSGVGRHAQSVFEDYRGEGFLVLCRRIIFLVTLGLAIYVDVDLAPCVEDGAAPTT